MAEQLNDPQAKGQSTSAAFLKMAMLASKALRAPKFGEDNQNTLNTYRDAVAFTKPWLQRIEEDLERHSMFANDPHGPGRGRAPQQLPEAGLRTGIRALASMVSLKPKSSQGKCLWKVSVQKRLHQAVSVEVRETEAEIRRLERLLEGKHRRRPRHRRPEYDDESLEVQQSTSEPGDSRGHGVTSGRPMSPIMEDAPEVAGSAFRAHHESEYRHPNAASRTSSASQRESSFPNPRARYPEAEQATTYPASHNLGLPPQDDRYSSTQSTRQVPGFVPISSTASRAREAVNESATNQASPYVDFPNPPRPVVNAAPLEQPGPHVAEPSLVHGLNVPPPILHDNSTHFDPPPVPGVRSSDMESQYSRHTLAPTIESSSRVSTSRSSTSSRTAGVEGPEHVSATSARRSAPETSVTKAAADAKAGVGQSQASPNRAGFASQDGSSRHWSVRTAIRDSSVRIDPQSVPEVYGETRVTSTHSAPSTRSSTTLRPAPVHAPAAAAASSTSSKESNGTSSSAHTRTTNSQSPPRERPSPTRADHGEWDYIRATLSSTASVKRESQESIEKEAPSVQHVGSPQPRSQKLSLSATTAKDSPKSSTKHSSRSSSAKQSSKSSAAEEPHPASVQTILEGENEQDESVIDMLYRRPEGRRKCHHKPNDSRAPSVCSSLESSQTAK